MDNIRTLKRVVDTLLENCWPLFIQLLLRCLGTECQLFVNKTTTKILLILTSSFHSRILSSRTLYQVTMERKIPQRGMKQEFPKASGVALGVQRPRSECQRFTCIGYRRTFTDRTQYRSLPIKYSNLNKKAAPPSVCWSFFYYEPFLFSGQLGIKGALPWEVALARGRQGRSRGDLRQFRHAAICEEETLFKLGTRVCLPIKITYRESASFRIL